MDRRTISTRKGSKRKLEQDFEHENQDRHKIPATDTAAGCESHQKLTRHIQTQVDILNSSFSSLEADRAAARRATSVLSQFAKTGTFLSLSLSTFRFFFYKNNCLI